MRVPVLAAAFRTVAILAFGLAAGVPGADAARALLPRPRNGPARSFFSVRLGDRRCDSIDRNPLRCSLLTDANI